MEIIFKGKRALVTGAGKGIGRTAAKALAQCGAEVIALARTQADLDTLVKEVPSIKPLCVDLCNIQEAVKAIEEQDDIHLLVNNAGVLIQSPFLDITEEQFDKVNSINMKGALFVAQAVARKMVSGGFGGAIVNVSSRSSIRASSNNGIYGPLKASLDMLTKVMALELGPHKIRVNSVNPTFVNETRMADQGLGRLTPDERQAKINTLPLGKYPEKEDVVNAILYLLSDKAAMVNGVNLLVDAGPFGR
ncbi:D-erythrulose reductase [Exaiptasia diaphana]|uniref:L-xylulose reductase n=1 Tax=Exaiptasia diaphana TaxID=2652724 RepID=A0A913X6V5_EXADI|nr:D-erythrulose reductase [Exaiptasia diaphana]